MGSVGKSLLKGAQEALAYAKGDTENHITHNIMIPNEIDVIDIRNHLGMTRKDFSEEFGFSQRTVEKWERGERKPEGPTRAYLLVIAHSPDAVRKALHESQ